MTLENRVKAEAYELFGLDSLKYESMPNGLEYTHYLYLSYAISELARFLVNLAMGTYEKWKKDIYYFGRFAGSSDKTNT